MLKHYINGLNLVSHFEKAVSSAARALRVEMQFISDKARSVYCLALMSLRVVHVLLFAPACEQGREGRRMSTGGASSRGTAGVSEGLSEGEGVSSVKNHTPGLLSTPLSRSIPGSMSTPGPISRLGVSARKAGSRWSDRQEAQAQSSSMVHPGAAVLQLRGAHLGEGAHSPDRTHRSMLASQLLFTPPSSPQLPPIPHTPQLHAQPDPQPQQLQRQLERQLLQQRYMQLSQAGPPDVQQAMDILRANGDKMSLPLGRVVPSAATAAATEAVQLQPQEQIHTFASVLMTSSSSASKPELSPLQVCSSRFDAPGYFCCAIFRVNPNRTC